MKSMMSSDIYNNTPIHYVAAKYDTAVFTDFMLHLPLSKRQRIADSPNMQLTNCRMIIYQKAFKEPFYIHDVLCDEATNTLVSKFADVHLLFNEDWEQKFQQTDDIYMYDENMLKVLKYSLNEYSLLDAAYITSHTLFSLAVDRQKSRQFYEKQKSKALSREEDSISVFIDIRKVDEPKQTSVQNSLNTMDLPEYNGKPKIAVLQSYKADPIFNVRPPGPDYAIISVQYHIQDYNRKPMPEVRLYPSVNTLVTDLSHDPYVQRVDVNSTLNKRYFRDDTDLLVPSKTITGEVSGPTKITTRLADDEMGRLFYITVGKPGSMTSGPASSRTCGPASSRTSGPASGKTSGPASSRTSGPASSRTSGPASSRTSETADITNRGRDEICIGKSQTLISGSSRGKALIICNNLELLAEATEHDKNISQSRKETLPMAQRVLANHLGLCVEVKQDLTAQEILSTILNFCDSNKHGLMVALVVLTHGKDGMIYGSDKKSNCSIQDVINSFNSGYVKDIPKLMFMCCCRGDISAIYNRAPHSFESSNEFPWPDNEVKLLYKPGEHSLPTAERDGSGVDRHSHLSSFLWTVMCVSPLYLIADLKLASFSSTFLIISLNSPHVNLIK
ncbi:hypothetical protein EB796_009038 [Bugula neritina]|uniref:Caspase family p20 domain-containing protein n=1 Tax=Bugula neritina TaxID=10212 RepID=A0A7J7K391_BUGNE|nr:hypothetical protein EB796_009038 [Bugula neritina]